MSTASSTTWRANTASRRITHFAVVAQSVGAVQAATWVNDYAPDIRCLVLASPAFKVELYVPFARAGLGLVRAVLVPFYTAPWHKL